jgi:hypothetical protein
MSMLDRREHAVRSASLSHHGLARLAVLVLLLHLPHGSLAQNPVHQEKHERPGKPGDWVVEKRSAGGLHARVSSVFITSDGHIRSKAMFQDKPQEGPVPQEALRKLNAAVLAAKLSTWKASYGDGLCTDCGTTTFRLEVCGADGKWVRYSGSWQHPPLPPDLEAVLAAMNF